MSRRIICYATEILLSVQLPTPGDSLDIMEYIVHNPLPSYSEDYVKAINLKTGVQSDKIREISTSIHNQKFSRWICGMVTLTIVKFAIGQPDGSGDLSSLLQSYYQNRKIPVDIMRLVRKSWIVRYSKSFLRRCVLSIS